MHRFSDGDHVVRPDTAVVAGHQHRPFGQRHENGIVYLELHRDFDSSVAGVEPGLFDVGLEMAKQRRRLRGFEARRLEVGRQAHLKNILGLIRWTKCLGIGTRQGGQSGIEALPDARIRVARLQSFRREPGNTFEVGQRRHIHNRQARDARPGDAAHQLPNPF